MTIKQLTLSFDWPNALTSANARPNVYEKRQAGQADRDKAFVIARNEAMRIGFVAPSLGRLSLRWTFCPPDRRIRDDDNIIGQLKPVRDGIARALRIDDNRFKTSHEWGEVQKDGRIVCRIAVIALIDESQAKPAARKRRPH